MVSNLTSLVFIIKMTFVVFNIMLNLKQYPVAFIPIPGGRSLRPVKNRGRGSFDKVADQNLFPIFYFPLRFTEQTTPLTKLSP